jgi:secretion/DNA translocation related TadE-like protein
VLREEDGNVTLLALVLALVLFVGLGIATEFCKVVIEHHRVKNAAEVAVLAGAQDLFEASGRACLAADEAARANSVEVDECVATNEDIVIRASTQISLFGRAYIVRENARAGFA